MEFRRATAADLGRAIADGKADPVALTEEFLAATGREDPARQIYARMTPERAIKEAQAARKRARDGRRRSRLDGVPVSWKDLYDSAGVATEAGSNMLAGRTPAMDAEALRRGSEAGLVCLGKTHMTELAFSGLGINPVAATPPNRAMPGHCPGGSSSGAAASLTHDLAALAIGSDTGGSIRLPAAWNNLVGFKPTHGAIPLDGVVPLCPGFDTAGPLARSVEDAALAFDVLCGLLPGDAPAPADPAALEIAVPRSIVLEDCEPAVLSAFEAALRRLETAGVRVARIGAPEIGELLALAPELFPYEAWAASGALVEAKGDLMYPPIRHRFRLGKAVSRERYDKARAQMAALRRTFHGGGGEARVLAFPTSPILPPRIDDMLADADRFAARNLQALRNTRVVNLTGGPGLNLPLPEAACGLQLSARPGADRLLLAAGLALERIVNP
jgi:aspartyl-tRNA(Asn)/glutamyl-tRNA(Gln) amidotransferase subunit A